MKLWILLPVLGLPHGDNPWEIWYDKSDGFIVRAATPEQAREIAQNASKFEHDQSPARHRQPWMDPRYSTCTELTQDGNPGVVMTRPMAT